MIQVTKNLLSLYFELLDQILSFLAQHRLELSLYPLGLQQKFTLQKLIALANLYRSPLQPQIKASHLYLVPPHLP